MLGSIRKRSMHIDEVVHHKLRSLLKNRGLLHLPLISVEALDLPQLNYEDPAHTISILIAEWAQMKQLLSLCLLDRKVSTIQRLLQDLGSVLTADANSSSLPPSPVTIRSSAECSAHESFLPSEGLDSSLSEVHIYTSANGMLSQGIATDVSFPEYQAKQQCSPVSLAHSEPSAAATQELHNTPQAATIYKQNCFAKHSRGSSGELEEQLNEISVPESLCFIRMRRR